VRTDDTSWFVAPTDVGAAVEALTGGGRVLAGGTDLVASMNLTGERPPRVVWIGELGLDRIEMDGETLRVGAGVSLAAVAASEVVRSAAAALGAAAAKIAGPAVRNLATMGGSLCAAWPRSDLGCAALGLDGVLVVAGPGGQRRVPMSELYEGVGRTVLAPDELVIELRLPRAAHSGYAKIGRRSSMTLPVVNAAVRLDLRDDGVVASAVVAVGVGSVPERAPSVEAALAGQPSSPESVAAAAALVLDDVEPADDEHASAWYRARVAPVAIGRAVEAAMEAAP
jgi:aerobic carbon-monoxide dehydrogenase medium subunit